MHIPINPKRRPSTKIQPTTITIHNTANPTSTAHNERNWLVNQYNDRTASWHIAIDDNMAVEAIPLNELAYHAGNTQGNNSSIGIELCESGDQQRVWSNAITLIARMLHERDWGIDRVKTHKSWSGKDCPRLILPHWDKFIADIQKELDKLNAPPAPEIPDWKKEGIEYLASQGILNDPKQWTDKADEPIPVWTAMTLIARVHKTLKEANNK